MNELNLHGIIPACVVTFDDDGRFDEAQYRRYLQWLLPQGPVALAINADTGEGPHLWPDERDAGPARRRRGGGRRAGHRRPERDVHRPGRRGGQARRATQARAGCSCSRSPPTRARRSTPQFRSRTTRRSRAAVGLPMVAFQLQPALGGVIFSEDTLRQIAAIDNVVALKEASFDARLYLLTRRMIERLERPIDLLTGDDNFIYESFVMGAEGALIGFGTLATELQVEMVELTRQGPLGRGARHLGADPAARGGRLRRAGARLPGPDQGRARGARRHRVNTSMRPPLLAVPTTRSAAHPRRTGRRRPVLMTDALAGRVVLVTGSSPRHRRRRSRRRPAAEGATVAVHYNDVARRRRPDGGPRARARRASRGLPGRRVRRR